MSGEKNPEKLLTDLRGLVRAIWAVSLAITPPALRDTGYLVSAGKLLGAASLRGWRQEEKGRLSRAERTDGADSWPLRFLELFHPSINLPYCTCDREEEGSKRGFSARPTFLGCLSNTLLLPFQDQSLCHSWYHAQTPAPQSC